MNPDEYIKKAYLDIEKKQKQIKANKFQESVERSQNRRILGALEAVADFARPGNYDLKKFSQEWTPYWFHAARVLKRYAGLNSTRNFPLPDDPSFVIAQELFEIILCGCSHHQFTLELHEHIERLKPDTEEFGRWDPRIALRRFFYLLSDQLRKYSDQTLAQPHAAEKTPQKTESTPTHPSETQASGERDFLKFTPLQNNNKPPSEEKLPPITKKSREQWLAEAMIMVKDHPELSVRAIARRVGVDHSTLARSPEFKRAAGIARQGKELPEGRKNRETGNLEAWDTESNDPERLNDK
ncbi:MAG: hypothetical protein HY717_11190 [Planctomycetes bacterium]|nr:hypothetical protein [Planctomycetota bacterium]